MLSPCVALRVNSAKQLAAQRDRPFAALRVTIGGSSLGDSPVMLSAAKQLAAPRDRPFAASEFTLGNEGLRSEQVWLKVTV